MAFYMLAKMLPRSLAHSSRVAAACPAAVSALIAATPSSQRTPLHTAATRSPARGGCTSSRIFARAASVAVHENPLHTANPMMCYQCEQTKDGMGCHEVGICGKTPEMSALQDLLVFSLKGLGTWAHHARTTHGITDPEVDAFVSAALFSTLTNVNFDSSRFPAYLQQCHELTQRLRECVAAAGGAPFTPPATPWFTGLPHPAEWVLPPADADDMTKLADYGHQVGLIARAAAMRNDTLLGLHELLSYGLKGAAAYAHHASRLGKTDPAVDAAFQEVLAFLSSPEAGDVDAVLAACLALGSTNVRVMQLLDEGHREQLGVPEPTAVSTAPRAGKAILVTGHDMTDLLALLQQTQGTGINVYTHGEMLPGHAYPQLKRFEHLAGHYGGAWYKQKNEFHAFPGAILVTTNCVLDPPPGSYEDRIFTTGETGVGGVAHVPEHDFSQVIARAQQLPGFFADGAGGRTLMVGFGHDTVLGAADQVLSAVHEGRLNHIFLIGGCDGSEPQRRYYAKLSQTMPAEALVLTLGCGKFRLLDQEWGTLPGTSLPRLLDMGQCNDAYGAVVVANALAKALGTDVNGLPLSLDISWFEQKAVAVLLSLLHLGVRNIRLGPRLPAFLTPDALQVLVDGYGLKPADTKDPDGDVARMLARA